MEDQLLCGQVRNNYWGGNGRPGRPYGYGPDTIAIVTGLRGGAKRLRAGQSRTKKRSWKARVWPCGLSRGRPVAKYIGGGDGVLFGIV